MWAIFKNGTVTDNQDEQPQVDVGYTAAFFPSASFQVSVSSTVYLQDKEMLQKLQLKKLFT